MQKKDEIKPLKALLIQGFYASLLHARGTENISKRAQKTG